MKATFLLHFWPRFFGKITNKGLKCSNRQKQNWERSLRSFCYITAELPWWRQLMIVQKQSRECSPCGRSARKRHHWCYLTCKTDKLTGYFKFYHNTNTDRRTFFAKLWNILTSVCFRLLSVLTLLQILKTLVNIFKNWPEKQLISI